MKYNHGYEGRVKVRKYLMDKNKKCTMLILTAFIVSYTQDSV